MKRSSHQDVACTPETEEDYGGKTGDDEYKESGAAVDDDTSDGKSCKDDKMAKLKKHPGAPKRFRTAFIIYSQQKHGELRAKLQEEGAEIDTINVARMVSDQWREMSSEEKERWEEMARQDKARYLKQKEEYAGPWKVPADMKKPKDPTAPKKPTPAYFSFSNERRQVVKKENPSATNGEISKILSKMWKDADDETRSVYIEKEKEERQVYNRAVEKWKQEKKDSGRENWWEHDTVTNDDDPGRDGGRGSKNKRSRLDLLADSAPQHGMTAVGQNRLDASEQGGLIGATPIPASALSTMIGLSGPLSMQELSALSSQNRLQAIASLLPSLLGQGSQVSDSTIGSHSHSNPFATHFVPPADSHPSSSMQIIDALQQILTQQQAAPRGRAALQSLGEGGNLSLASLLGAGIPSRTSALSNQNASGAANQSGHQANLLAALMGAAMSQQQQQQQQQSSSIHSEQSANSLQGVNVHALLSILGGGSTGSSRTTQQQQIGNNPFLAQLSLQDLQSLQQLSLLQQGLLQGNALGGSSASSEARPNSGALSGDNTSITDNSTWLPSSSPSLAALLGLHHLGGGSGRGERTTGSSTTSASTPQLSSQFHSFLSQQPRLEATSSDHLRDSLLQSWLQQQQPQQQNGLAGGARAGATGSATPTMSTAMMEDIIARLMRGRNQEQ